jgi:hypothetical protein
MTLRTRLWSHGSPMTILNVGGGGMVSNHRLVLFTHALCRLSYPATLRTTAPGFKSGLFRDRARRSERSSWALPSWSPLRSHRPDPSSPGPSQSIDSPPLPRKRSSRGEGRCRLVGGSIRNLALCSSPRHAAARRCGDRRGAARAPELPRGPHQQRAPLA